MSSADRKSSSRKSAADEVFFKSWSNGLLLFYLTLVALILFFTARYAGIAGYTELLRDPDFRGALILSLETSTIATLLAVVVAVPGAYALSRYRFPGQNILDTILDLPIVLPPLIMGVCLLIFFSPAASPIGAFLKEHDLRVAYTRPAIVIAQFMVAGGFTIRCLKATFDSMTPRYEQVARTLGCSSSRAFFTVALPLAKGGIVAGAIMTWARAIGEFGPIIVFAGSISGYTLVLPTAIFLKMQVGDLEPMAAGTMVLVFIATVALLIFKRLGGRGYIW
ncbi:MAG: ABC transporter permease subunit [Armatimonadetes bacterium]|nr:ABC transporter permease subunit [Armatimonadota bacterium]NIM23991.1 ABC transporter permease subunit [Armatimonadota bacterium]NIM67841.1 ABC transporter permease subunit [Armatimonadota bacterium]NIM76372.1 ABC transporter permease subunit [Armatimonadota bacterium]NIN06071.1 ABC transporter permease subunit [Armatimonadota bacterium]